LRQVGSAHVGRFATPAGALLALALLVGSPDSPITLLRSAGGNFRASSPAPAPAALAGAGGLGYAQGALPAGLLHDVSAVIDTYAGKGGAVFDFTNAPALLDFLIATRPSSRFYDVNLTITDGAQQQAVDDLETSRPRLVLFEGVVGMPRWDFLENEVRDHVIADYLLSHYRPLALVDGELFLVSDALEHLPPLPALTHPAVTDKLYFSQRSCAFGYAPNFLGQPSGAVLATLPLVPVPAPRQAGRVFEAILPRAASAYDWIRVNRSGVLGTTSLALSDLRARSRRDLTWVDVGTESPALEAGTCLQWHGFARQIFVRYSGPGSPTSLSLFG
jgi:hypothetical protein